MTNETGQPGAVAAALARHSVGDPNTDCRACRSGLPCDAAVLAAEVERLTERVVAAERVIAELRDVLPLVEASGFYPGPLMAAVAAYDTPAPARTEE